MRKIILYFLVNIYLNRKKSLLKVEIKSTKVPNPRCKKNRAVVEKNYLVAEYRVYTVPYQAAYHNYAYTHAYR